MYEKILVVDDSACDRFELLKQKNIEHKLHQQKLMLDAIFYQAPIGIAISHNSEPFNADSNNLFTVNPMFEQITGRTKEELLQLGWAKITHPDDIEDDMNNFKKLQSGEIENYSMEKRYIKLDGSIVWVNMVAAPLNLFNEQKYNYICLVQDITKRKSIEADLFESERSKSVLLSHLPGMAYRCNYDQGWTIQFVSDGCLELTCYKPESLLNSKVLTFKNLIAPEYQKPIYKEWERVLADRLPFKYEYEIITAKGERKWVLEMGQGIYDEEFNVIALEGIVLDISDRKEIENNLNYNNEHDTWTGLYNRRYLENLLRHDAMTRTDEKRALVSINLSAMNLLSMTYGFHYSQEIIKKVAEALNYHCTDKCQLFITYENRFVFYMKNYKDKKELTTFCESVADKLESLLDIERVYGGIGVIEIDKNNEIKIEQLLKNLLIASENAINILGRDFGYCFFDTEMEAHIIREELITHELTQIAAEEDNGGLLLRFQPILDLKSNKICSFEALTRIKCDNLGLVPPLEFIPIAEKTKLIIPIGNKIILQALNFLKKLKVNGHDTIVISINISAIQLLRSDFSKSLFEMINEMQVRPENICLEITESIFASNYQEINNILRELKDYGIMSAIDDFGTEYSSLARQRELNVDCLKIDKYFIDNLILIDPEEAITGDIISMVHKLGHYVVAEGVEHENQKEYLMRQGCDKIQGYLVGKPLDEDESINFLNKKQFNALCKKNTRKKSGINI